MPRRYKDIFPSSPLLSSEEFFGLSAVSLMEVRYFQAEPDSMPEDVFEEHHVLLNLNENAHRVHNIRNGQLHDFVFRKNDIVVTPAGVRSGWRWFARSDVIVITLDPEPVRAFAERELGLLLSDQQLSDLPLFADADIVAAGIMLRDAIRQDEIGSVVMFEALARVFLVKLLQKYGQRRPEEIALSAKFTSSHHRRVLDHVEANIGRTIVVEDLAREVGMSPSHFSRVFKEVIGKTPMQYVMTCRIERALKIMADEHVPLSEIAVSCGFADQAHFSRSFKQTVGTTPSKYRQNAAGRA